MTNPEILSLNDSKASPTTTENLDDALINKIGREGKMIGLGIARSIGDVSVERIPELTGAAMLGGSLGVLAESGRAGVYVAAGIGLSMAGKLIYDEVTGGRWSKFGQAWSDNWQSGQNMERNIELTKASLGNFAVDMGIGYAGFAAGGAMARGFGKSSLVESKLAGPAEFGGRTGEMAMVPALVESGMRLDGLGRRISADAGKGAGETGLLAEVNKALEKRQPAHGLDQIKEAALNAAVDRDGAVIKHKADLRDLVRERQELSGKDHQIRQEVATHNAELTNLRQLTSEDLAVRSADGKMSPEMKAVRAAEESVENLKTLKNETLPQKEAQLKQLDQQIQAQDKAAKEEGPAKGKGKGKDEAPVEDGPDLKQQRIDLRAEIRDLKESTSDQAFQRARARVAEEQGKWQSAKDAAPTRINELVGTEQSPGILTLKQTELSTHQTQITSVAERMQATLDLLNQRSAEIKGNSALSQPLPPEAVTADKPVRKAATSDGAGTPEPTVKRDGAPAVKEVKETTPVVAKTPEIIAKENVDASMTAANELVRPYQLHRELRQAQTNLQDIKSGKFDSSFADVKAKEHAIEQAEVRIAKIKTDQVEAGPQKYAQAVKGLKQYATAVEEYLAKEADGGKRDAVARQAVINLEQMMPSVDNLYKGIPGEIPDLRRINTSRPFDAYKRLGDIGEHLEKRIQNIDGNQNRRIGKVMDNPIIQSVLDHKGELPKDGAVFFIKDGTIVEAAAPSGAKYPQMIDVARLMKGVDKDGAGLYRFIGHEDINGAVIIEPVLGRDGKPKMIEGRKGESRMAKQVWGTIGEVPETLKPGLSFGNAIKNFGSEGQIKQAMGIVSSLEKLGERPDANLTFFRHGQVMDITTTLSDIANNGRAKDALVNKKAGGVAVTDANGVVTEVFGSVPQGIKPKASLTEWLEQMKKAPEEVPPTEG